MQATLSKVSSQSGTAGKHHHSHDPLTQKLHVLYHFERAECGMLASSANYHGFQFEMRGIYYGSNWALCS